MPRPRIHKDNAARQAAYRKRLADSQAATPAPRAATTADADRLARVRNAVQRIDPSIDTSALEG